MIIVAAIGERWNAFWRRANALALAMDADPLEDIYSRVRRLEAQAFGAIPADTAAPNPGPDGSGHQLTNRKDINR
jgi:hypothetical protein